jgi:hypothetical protein
LGAIYYGIFASGEKQSWSETVTMTSSETTAVLALSPVVKYGEDSQVNIPGLPLDIIERNKTH